MAKQKVKRKSSLENVQKLLRDYWKTFEPEKVSETEIKGNGKMDSSAESDAKQPL